MSSNSAINVHHMSAAQIPELVALGYYLQFTDKRALNPTPHDHNFYEVVCLASGSCVHTVNDVRYTLQPGSISLVLPGQVHFLCEQAAETNVIALSFTCDEARLFSNAFPIDDFPQTIMTERGTFWQIQRLGERLLQNRGIDTPLAMRALLGIIFACFAEGKATLQSSIPKNIEALLAKVNNIDIAAEGVPAFLRVSNYSYSQLSRLTKQYVGKTPGEYINTLRLQFAYEMITGDILDYELICDTVGFSSFSHFCKLIRSAYGLTPAKLRKQAQNKAKTV